MSDRSAIEWTDATWNPVRGCSKLSAGCKFCYAEVFAERFRGVPGHPFEQGFDLRLVPQKLNEPIGWRKPRRIFVNSMSDLFHEDIPIDYLAAIGDVMLRADWHVYQVLTRRHERMHALLTGPLRWMARLPHVWFGVSVENRKHGLPRLAALRETPASVRFVSMEPVLEDLGTVDLSGIDWAIVGGESGAHARPMARDWVVGIRQQCQAQGVAFFFKQWGGVHKKAAGRMLDGRTYDEFPMVASQGFTEASRWHVSRTQTRATGRFYVLRSEDPTQPLLMEPEPDLTPLRGWVLKRVRERPRRWSDLDDELRPEIWRAPHLGEVNRALRVEHVIVAEGYQGKFSRKANPLLRLRATQ